MTEPNKPASLRDRRARVRDAAIAELALLTYEDVGAILRVHRRTIERLIKRGDLKTVRFLDSVRFHRDDVAAFIEAGRGRPRPPADQAEVE